MEDRVIEFELRVGTPADAEAIYALKVAAFGGNFLPFTVYRSSKSLTYIRSLILAANAPGSRVRIAVISERDSVMGYYQAAPVGAAFFLNYIAVAEGARRMGLGGRLHSDFESWGVNFGFESAALDVFTSNRGVPDWYFRRGYKLLEKRYHARIDLSAVAPGRKKIVGRAEDWARALADEQRQGFARLTVRVGESNVELGLIDGCAVKALSWFDLTLEDCVGAIASSLAGERSELIVSGLEQCPVGLPYLAVEPALRLTRELRGDRQ